MARGALVVVVGWLLGCSGIGGGGADLGLTHWQLEWIGEGVHHDLQFLPDGTFVDTGHPKDHNTWSVSGSRVHLEYNDGFVSYDGSLADGATMGGTFRTQKGLSGNWRAVRLR